MSQISFHFSGGCTRCTLLYVFLPVLSIFCSQEFLYGNFHSLRYLFMWCYTAYLVVWTSGLGKKNLIARFLSTKSHTLLVTNLRTKSDIRTTTYAIKHHMKFSHKQAWEQKIYKKRTKVNKNVNCIQRTLPLKRTKTMYKRSLQSASKWYA